MQHDDTRATDRCKELERRNAEIQAGFDRLRVEMAALAKSEDLYRRMLDAVNDYVYHVQIEHGAPAGTTHSAACEAVTGYTPAEFAASRFLWLDMVPAEDRGRVIEHARRIVAEGVASPIEHRIRRKDGMVRWVCNTPVFTRDETGRLTCYEGLVRDITARKEADLAQERLIAELQEALHRVKHLSGLLPICAGCKRIRDDQGYWEQVETYIAGHSEAEFTHALCPDCAHRLYPELYEKRRAQAT